MQLVFDRRAAKTFARPKSLPRKVANTIRRKLGMIAANPFTRHRNVTALPGVPDAFRVRHGAWSIGYRIDRKAGIVHVEWIES